MTAVAAARAGIVTGGALVGVLSASRAYDVGFVWLWASDVAVAVTFAAVAAVAMPVSRRVTALAAGVCATWALAAWWPFALYWHRGFLVPLLVLLAVGAESLWPRGRAARAMIGAAMAVSLTPFVWQWDAAAIVLGCGLVVAAFTLPVPQPRRAESPAFWALVVLGVVFAVSAASPLLVAGGAVFEVRAVGYATGLVVVGVLAGFAARPQSAGRAIDAVLELGAQPDDAVREGLAAALRDRSLEVGWWSAGAGGFFTTSGAEVRIPMAGERRQGLVVDADGAPLAVVVGDARRVDDAGVREAILRASRLREEHDRLSTRLRQATLTVEQSQRRLIDTATAERSALAARLDHDVGEPLRALRSELGSAASASAGLRSAQELVDRAMDELSAIARGLDPPSLRGGLSAALEELIRDVPLTVVLTVEAEPDDRMVAQAVYYVCAEAVANAVKHAEGTRVRIRVAATADGLDVTISDDGRGGAPFPSGSGLRGLTDRVAALGGTLHASSSDAGGTVVRARIPLALAPFPVAEPK